MFPWQNDQADILPTPVYSAGAGNFMFRVSSKKYTTAQIIAMKRL
jgi:hypothetical protein